MFRTYLECMDEHKPNANRRKYHILYKTTCTVTGKFYIGMHSTDILDDGYLGSGKRLRYSLDKHGKENHIREVLEMFPDRESLKEREAGVVTKPMLYDEACMNLTEGGNAAIKARSEAALEQARVSLREFNEKLKSQEPPTSLFVRECPKCHRKMQYKHHVSFEKAKCRNSTCRVCSGCNFSQAWLDKQADRMRNRTITAETRAKISASRRGKPTGKPGGMLGKHHTDAAKAKIAARSRLPRPKMRRRVMKDCAVCGAPFEVRRSNAQSKCSEHRRKHIRKEARD